MPRSRSSSFESMTRSLTRSWPENAALMEQCVHKGGLAMVDVRHNRDIAPKRVGDPLLLQIFPLLPQTLNRHLPSIRVRLTAPRESRTRGRP